VQGAIAAYERALELAPDDAAACSNLGLMYLSHLGDPHGAQRYFERAIALDPSSVAAQANLGLSLEEQGQVNAALAHYEKLIAANPAESEYRWNRGLALLGAGGYARGWEDYELRNARAGAVPRAFPYPVWRGGELRSGAALLVYAEQGLGDEIMFASCVPDLLARGIKCVIECDLRLARLFARSFPAAHVHGAARDGDRGWLTGHPEVEAQIAIGSLPRLLRQSAADFPSHGGYLHADPLRIAHWRARLAHDNAGFNIGITWRGGTAKTRRDLRSIPLRELAPVFETPRAVFIILQRDAGDAPAEITAAHGARVLSVAEALNDVDETAALLQALDCVIAVDNTVAHLAGALGCASWILLPYLADWRWLRAPSNSPWYPSVMLRRQPVSGDWAPVIARVATELKLRS
jgi:tetratricopeptide (TPR) repeat protein